MGIFLFYIKHFHDDYNNDNIDDCNLETFDDFNVSKHNYYLDDKLSSHYLNNDLSKQDHFTNCFSYTYKNILDIIKESINDQRITNCDDKSINILETILVFTKLLSLCHSYDDIIYISYE